METKLKTAPLVEPVTTAEAKTHMNVDFSTDDTYIGLLCTAAREYVEQITNRKLISQTWYGYLPTFPGINYIELPFGNVQSVTSVKYKDSAGTESTLTNTNYIIDTSFTLGRIVLAYNYTWPSFTEYPTSAVTVEWVCGYGDAATAVPGPIKQAIKLLIADMYELRESMVAGVSVSKLDIIDRLLMPFRIFRY
jgi:uncharacterized phiE125 gp8 family phage protein